jgi:thymidylate synthase
MFVGKEESGYLELLKYILDNGDYRIDRTGVGTRMIPHAVLEFDLQSSFPLLTTKKVFFKGVAHELLWMLRGDSNIQYLNQHSVHIWDEWADQNGDLGPVYGSQWRNWLNLEGRKIDQISELIEALKASPYSRRHLVSAWNVGEIEHMHLPPCHFAFQFTIFKEKLNCHMTMRSVDTFLGMPFNIASYALLTRMIASQVGREAGSLFLTANDCHLYENHIEQVKEQLTREPLEFPKLELDDSIKSIDDFKYEHIRLIDYKSHSKIGAPIAI